jgi:hypothetical protein
MYAKLGLSGLLYQRPASPRSATPRLRLPVTEDLRPDRVGLANHLIELIEPKQGHSLIRMQPERPYAIVDRGLELENAELNPLKVRVCDQDGLIHHRKNELPADAR